MLGPFLRRTIVDTVISFVNASSACLLGNTNRFTDLFMHAPIIC